MSLLLVASATSDLAFPFRIVFFCSMTVVGMVVGSWNPAPKVPRRGGPQQNRGPVASAAEGNITRRLVRCSSLDPKLNLEALNPRARKPCSPKRQNVHPKQPSNYLWVVLDFRFLFRCDLQRNPNWDRSGDSQLGPCLWSIAFIQRQCCR